MKNIYAIILIVGLFGALVGGNVLAEIPDKDVSKAAGPPPALVVTAAVTQGKTEPMQELVGTIYYTRISRVATEIDGLVERVTFEEGDEVGEGAVLVDLSSDLLDQRLAGSRAAYEQVLVEQEGVVKDLARIEPLYREGTMAESVFDGHYYTAQRLQKKAAVLKADLGLLELEKEKKSIVAPFAGIVVEKQVERGEWLPLGGTVAIIADHRRVDVVVDVPAHMLEFFSRNRDLDVTVGGRRLSGRFVSYVPKGDVATRTFRVKIRLPDGRGLVEGMEARVLVVAAPAQTTLLVPRDAVIEQFGRKVIFVVRDGFARMVAVEVSGYSGMAAGISGPGLAVDLPVVIKGNERLRDGQPVALAD